MRNGLFVVLISIILCTSMLNIFSLVSLSYPIGWSEDIRLTNNTNNSGQAVVGVWENYVHVFWLEQIPGPGSEYDIFYRRSTDASRTWEDTRKLIDTDKVLGHLSVALNQSTIHLVWWDKRSGIDRIYYTKSNDSGQNWETERDIISPSSGKEPNIAISGNNLHVVYMNDFKLYYLNSSDNGISWSEAQQLTGSIRDSAHPEISVNESNVHIVWMDHYDKNGQSTLGAIFYMNSTDGGLSWSEDINLTEMDLDATYPYIAVNKSIIHIVYSKELAGLWQGYYRRSEDNGITWSEEIKILNSSNDIYVDSFSIEKDKIHAVGGAVYISNEEIYYVEGYNNGQNWDPQIMITYSPGNSQRAKITVYEGKLHVAWHDYRDGNPEIYYKYYPFYHPPTNLTIDMWGTNLTLNWTTPQTGLSPLDYYLIYRVTDPEAFTFSDSEIIYNSSGTGTDLLTTWNDTNALLDETNNYYYVVRAVHENGEIDTNENIVGKFVIPLNQGWNLFSIPLAQNNTKISEILKSTDGNYNIVQWYDAKNGIWRSSPTSMTEINRTMGLWIHMKNKCNLSVVGALPESTDIALYEGWNLVGYPSLKASNLNDALSGINWQAVQRYDAFDSNDHWKHNSTSKPDNLNDLKEMQPGRGYWVYITINDTWIRTRTVEDNNVVIWRFSDSDEINGYDQSVFKRTIRNQTEMEKEDDYQMDNVDNEKQIIRNEENNLAVSLIPLIILITFIFAEKGYFHKRRK
ncbi:MAG: exo-alpha-sialidase [Thermoplasmata archaeon]|nr:MAG: exo-alpha-sialidase [Thermoplasmata archaeon]